MRNHITNIQKKLKPTMKPKLRKLKVKILQPLVARRRNVVRDEEEVNTVEEVVITVAEDEVTSTAVDVVDIELEMKTKMDLLRKQERSLNQEEEVAGVDIVVIVAESVVESAVESVEEREGKEESEDNEESIAAVAEESDEETIVPCLRVLLSQLSNNSNHNNE